jgi:hypothetical protein
MYRAVADIMTTDLGDSVEFMAKARALAVAQDNEPAHLYVIRIDNWFGPKWMHFAGKFTAGNGAAMGVHKSRLHVPPFVPSRVLVQRIFVGPGYEETMPADPLHIECSSKQALSRRIEDIDKDAAFIWISGGSEMQQRGAVMVYRQVAFDPNASRRGKLGRRGAFYVGFSHRNANWEPAMLHGISRNEVAHLEESGRALIGGPIFTAAGE